LTPTSRSTSATASCSSPRRARPPRSRGSLQDLYLIVDDIGAAREELISRGVEVTEVWHGRGAGGGGRQPGPDPGRNSYRSFASFSDPDGNGWLLQEIKLRLPGRE
jgi:hypothetical protein